MDGRQAGDPVKLARALIHLADSGEAPLRWVAGERRMQITNRRRRLCVEH